MSEEMARRLAEDIVSQGIYANPWFNLALALVGIAATLGAGLGAYVKKEFENFATREDFQGFEEQLRASTRTAEEVKAAIVEQRQKKTLIREKLEQCILETYELEGWWERVNNEAEHGIVRDVNNGPFERLKAFQMIYFPQLGEEVENLRIANGVLFWRTVELADAKRPPFESEYTEHQLREYIQMSQKDFQDKLAEFRTTLIDQYAENAGL
jgi:hypothetical protein